jgi:hypothetical protein
MKTKRKNYYKIFTITLRNKSNLPKYPQLDEASPQTHESSHSCSTASVWSNMLDAMLVRGCSDSNGRSRLQFQKHG